VLVRTGATAATAAGVLSGVNDEPLSDLGVEQARQAAALLTDLQARRPAPLRRTCA
jgi:broad specificity phosphatase PhoE